MIKGRKVGYGFNYKKKAWLKKASRIAKRLKAYDHIFQETQKNYRPTVILRKKSDSR